MLRISFGLFLFTLAFAPLAFGTVEHWSLMTVETLAVFTLLICLLGLKQEGQPFLRVPGFLPLFLLFCFILLQLIPLPVALLKILSPMSWEAYRPVYELSGDGGWLPITVNRKATLQELLRLGSYGLFYILTIQLLRTGERVDRTLKFLAILGSCVAFFAILQQFSSEGKIYWIRYAPSGHPGGPWVNINQYAAFIESICPLVLALFLVYKPRSASRESFRERFITLFSSPGSNMYFLLGFAFVLMIFSVYVTLCRGGVITIFLSLVLFALLSGYRRKSLSRLAFWIVICLALVAISWFGWQPIIDEFGNVFDSSGAIRDARIQLWSDTLVLIKDYPFVGGGFGTYNDIYPSYKTIASNLMFDHAHNDYLELLAIGGIIGFGLVSWFCFSVLSHGIKKVMVRRHRFAVLLGVGAITSISALLIHSTVDFNLQNGAVGLYFFFLCGLLVAIVNSRYDHYEGESLLRDMNARRGYGLLAFSGAFLVVVTVTQFCVMLAADKYNSIKEIYVTKYLADEIVEDVREALEAATLLDPLEGHYPFYWGDVVLVKKGRTEALDSYLEAAYKQPMNGWYIQRLGMMMGPGVKEEAAVLVSEGYTRALNKDSASISLIRWLLANDMKEEALIVARDRLELAPYQFDDILILLEGAQLSTDDKTSILPESVTMWIRYGDHLEKKGELDTAEYYRVGALDFLDKEESIRPHWFNQLIHFYRKTEQPDKAVETIRMAMEYLPDYAAYHIWLGDYYHKEGITYRAQEEYERAVMLDPKNKSYQRKLRKLKLDIEFGD